MLPFFLSIAHAQDSNKLLQDLIKDSIENKLASKVEWGALLHTINGKPLINARYFLLSFNHFSLQQELELSVESLLDPNLRQAFSCKFPARAVWIQQNLPRIPSINIDSCSGFQEYLNNVSTDNIDIVYVSENMSQPSSMMGHILLAFSGVNKQHKFSDYAVSFYTEIKGINLPKIMFDSMVVGKKGYFSLTPIKEKLERYQKQEQRNVWFYTLKLTSEQKERMLYHVWELKAAPLRYYFNKYNCATLTHFILATTGNQEINANTQKAQTPLDVVKEIIHSKIVDKTRFSPSSKYAVKMLESQHDYTWRKNLQSAVMKQDIKSFIDKDGSVDQLFQSTQAVDFYKNLLLEQEKILPEQADFIDKQLDDFRLPNNLRLDLSKFKLPENTPEDSQVTFGVRYDKRQGAVINLEYLPAAHKLEDDNSQSMGETELLLGNIGIRYLTNEHKLKLDKLILYSTSSYVPYDLFTQSLSGSFSISYKDIFNSELKRYQAINIDGGGGLTFELYPNLYGFFTGNLGVDYKHNLSSYFSPHLGLIANERLDMKSIMQYQRKYPFESLNQSINLVQFIQSKRVNQKLSVHLSLEQAWNANSSERSITLGIKNIF